MPPDLRLGYLVFEVRRPARWTAFCEQMLGLPAPSTNADGSLGWQLDAACQRLIAQEGPADDLAAIGLECASDAVLDRLLRHLQEAGQRVAAADGVTPSGFDFEIGAGTQTIDPAGWETHHTDVTSAWGHKPKLRLQLKMAAGLIARKIGGAARPAAKVSP